MRKSERQSILARCDELREIAKSIRNNGKDFPMTPLVMCADALEHEAAHLETLTK